MTALARRWRDGLFGGWANSAVTVATLAFLGWILPPLLRWAFLDAVWRGGPQACQANPSGACWVFIGEKIRFILFGLYPPDRQGWALAAILVMVALLIASCAPRLWGRGLVVGWVVGLVAAILLMRGGVASTVPTSQWGGLPLTLLLSTIGLATAFPVALALALARRSHMGITRLGAILMIEIVRGVPLIAVLYAATLLFPLMLPHWLTIDKLAAVQVAFSLFVACYMAEIIRAGLNTIPRGQYEAADSLGLSWWAGMRLVVLPQALRVVIPSFVTLAIGVLQDSTLVAVIGLYDFLNSARLATTDPAWLGHYNEAYAFGALVYFILCYAGSRYSLWLERHVTAPR